jgi:hypothetical protein
LREDFEFGTPTDEGDDALSRFAASIATGEPTTGFWSHANAGWCLL